MAERVPPHHLDAEEALLGSMFLSRDACEAVAHLSPADFYRPQHGSLFGVLLELHLNGEPIDPTIVAARWPGCEEAGGKPYLLKLVAEVPASANAAGYARIVRDDARQRRLITALGEAAELAYERKPVTAALDRVLAEDGAADDVEFLGGDTFILDESTDPGDDAVWGDGDRVVWAAGEPFLIVGPTGVGKTTITHQLVRARLGLRDDVLGLSVRMAGTRILYLACDRPRQIARAFRRVFTDDDRGALVDGLAIWSGPPPANFAEDTAALHALARKCGADTVIIDSLKDVGLNLNEPQSGQNLNISFQRCVADGIEVLGLHHTRKSPPGTKTKRGVQDVYGGWISEGAGSIVMLDGEPGDSVVQWVHLKQPVEMVGPWEIVHDHTRGESHVHRGNVDIEQYLANRPGGVTAEALARTEKGGTDPNRNEVERMRRKLERKVQAGRVLRRDRGGELPVYVLAVPDDGEVF